MLLYFLEAKVPLSKTYKKIGKRYKKYPYPLAKNLTSYKENVSSLDEFKEALARHSEAGHCLIKGELTRDLDVESRADATDPFIRTSWICLDFDYFESDSKIEGVLQQLGLSNVSYIKQYSAGHKITKNYSVHLFFLLDTPVLPEQLKHWLMFKNLKIEVLNRLISLQRTNVALLWPLDVAVAFNSTLIYIAPPTCIGFNDPIKERFSLIKKEKDSIDLSEEISGIDGSVVEELKQTRLNELRRAKGLRAKKFTNKVVSGIEVCSKPGAVTVTGHKQARGFMYLNLNGGDSWGYYHPVENPEILYNFKGEPNYLTKEIVPDYFRAYRKAQLKSQQAKKGDVQHFAFLDRRTDKYYRGIYDPQREELEIFPTDSIRKVEDFLRQNDQWVGEYIEEWDYLFRFDDDRIYVPEERFANRFIRSPYIRQRTDIPPPKKIPPTIKKVIYSVCGNDIEVVKHFLNWLAVILQYRQRTQTIWVFSGTQGTGKGVLVHEILTPIFGRNYVQAQPLTALEDLSNAFMESCVLLMIDESKRTQVKDREKVMARLKQCSTDPVIPIRRMRTDHYMVKNYLNVIIASNYPDPIVVEQSDRRFNVAPYQAKRLPLTKHEVEEVIPSELEDFTALLYHINADIEKAKRPLDNEARKQLMYLTQTSLEITFGAILKGDLQFFINDLPTDDEIRIDAVAQIEQDRYINVLREAEQHALAGSIHRLTRDQARALAQYTLGDMPKTANKFTSLAKHYGINFSRLRKNSKMVQAIEVKWNVGDILLSDILQQTPRLRSVK